jgi:bifunctional non-homologous end joining protein LigD
MPAKDMAGGMRIGRRTVELSNRDKVFFPASNITKGDLIDYYYKVSENMIPHLEARPLTMHRFPDGIDGEGFYQQEISDYFPEWIDRVTVRKEGGTISHAICQNAATLIYLANQACITPHVWLSRKDRLDYPDLMVFDLDPPADDFDPVKYAAQLLGGFLRELGMRPFVKTTGSRGLHVVVPLDRSADFEEVRHFAHDVAATLVEREPDQLTIEQRKEKRSGRVFIDYSRNSYGLTVVPPYAVRAKAGAPIATPIDWDELRDKDLTSQSYTMKNVFRRISHKQDPWRGIGRKTHSLSKAKRQLWSLTNHAV